MDPLIGPKKLQMKGEKYMTKYKKPPLLLITVLAISAAIVAKLYDADNTVISMMLASVLELSSKDGGKHHQKARKCGSQIVFVCLMQPAVRKPYGRGKGREPKKRTARKRQRAVPPRRRTAEGRPPSFPAREYFWVAPRSGACGAGKRLFLTFLLFCGIII